MRAIGVTEFGGPEALRELDLPDPIAGPGEVRVRVHAAAVNPTDTLLRSGHPASRFEGKAGPFVPGMDAVGVVDALGPDPDGRLRVGQRVVALIVPSGTRGAYAERVVLPAGSVVPAPRGSTTRPRPPC